MSAWNECGILFFAVVKRLASKELFTFILLWRRNCLLLINICRDVVGLCRLAVVVDPVLEACVGQNTSR